MEKIQTITVVGAGTMGQGIARSCAAAGYKTKLFDVQSDLTRLGMNLIQESLSSAVAKGKLSKTLADGVMANIVPCSILEELSADLTIEAVIEKMEVKQDLFTKLEEINDVHSILATNTSSLSVSEIAAVLKNPDRCVGIHFFNPAHLMKLVEVIAGEHTSEAVISAMLAFSKKLDKTPVLVKDSPGFIVNRVARHYYVESLKVVEDGVADFKAIDNLLRSAGFKMGPFELMDLIGIDTNYFVTSSLYEAFGKDPKFKPNPIQELKVKSGHLGRKTGKGFYEYEKN